jgi:hypothetical protein
MTELEIDAIVGRTRRELREARQQLSALEAEAHKLAEIVKGLIGPLGAPQSIVFEGQEYDESYAPIGHRKPFRDSDFTNLNPSYLRSLSEEARAHNTKIAQLRTRLKELDPDTI